MLSVVRCPRVILGLRRQASSLSLCTRLIMTGPHAAVKYGALRLKLFDKNPDIVERVNTDPISRIYDMDDAEMRYLGKEFRRKWKSSSEAIPKGWSNDWLSWPLIFPLFWTCPYLIDVPQITMLVSIKYRIPGITRPIMFDVEHPNQFVFEQSMEELQKSDLYLGDCQDMTVSKIDGSPSETEFMETLKVSSWRGIGLTKLEADRDGQAILDKIVEGGGKNEDVVDLLSGFLSEKPQLKRLVENEAAKRGSLLYGEDGETSLMAQIEKDFAFLETKDDEDDDEDWDEDDDDDDDYDDEEDLKKVKPGEVDETSIKLVDALLNRGLNGKLTPEEKLWLGDWEDTEEGSRFGNPEFDFKEDRGTNRRS